MNTNKTVELKNIADRLAKRSNDAQALSDFNVFVRSISQAERRELVVVLQKMIAEARAATEKK